MTRFKLLLAVAMISLCATAQNVTTSSSSMTTSPWAVSVPYNISDEGTKHEFKFGMGGWSWDFFALQQRNHCGKENLDIARVGFNGRFDKAYDALTAEQKAAMDTELRNIVQTGVKSIFLLCGIGNVGNQQGDLSGVPSWNETTRTNYVDDIVRAVEYVEGKGYKVFAVAPFNEPDFEKTYTGNASNFNAVAAIMQTRPQLAGRVFGPSTLNSSEAPKWYSTVKDNINYANTHQLAGGRFSDYTGFWAQAYKDGKLPVADEMHNVMEAMVCINYGGVAGTWWGWEGITRGEYIRMIKGGTQLAYKERPNEWMTASVNKYTGDNGRVEAFIGTSERQAVASAFTFISKGRLAYYDGQGPAYDHTEEVPGDPTGAYQKGQTNAERLIQIHTGEDVPVEPINGQYKIVNKATGKVLSLNGGRPVRGNVYQWIDGGQANQVWDVYPIDKTTVADYSYVVIRNANTSGVPLYLDAQAWNMDNGANVTVYSDGDDLSTQPNVWQRWYLRYMGDGYYHIINHFSGLYVGINGSNTANGANVVELNNNGGDNLLWKFILADSKVETTAPEVPIGLTATAQEGAVKLTWTANEETDIHGYMVYRYNDGADIWECIGRKVRGTAFLDNTCRKGQPLRYRIKALDDAYNLSEASAEVTSQTATNPVRIGQWTGLSNRDSDNNKLHAVMNGATLTTDKERPAFSFDGKDDYMKLPYHVGDMEQMTFTAWVKTSSTSAWQRIFDFGNGEDEYLFLTPTNGSNMRFEIKKDGVMQGLDATDKLGIGLWKHVAVTIGTDEVCIYIDGELNASTKDITLRPSDVVPTLSYLGRSQFDADPTFKGMMSDVRIYNYALTAEEIKGVSGDSVSSEGVDITAERIPAIADNLDNWTYTGPWSTWTDETEHATTLTSPYVRTTSAGVSTLSKALTYLPEGQYKLAANVYAYNYGSTKRSQYLYLNEQTLAINSANNRSATLRSIVGTVAPDGKMEFGLKATSASSAANIAMDNVQLIFQGTAAEYIEGINNITYDMLAEALTLVDKPMNATPGAALRTAVDAANTAMETYIAHIENGTATPADVEAWISALESIPAAASNAKVSVEAYKPLATQVAAAHTKAATYPQKNGNDLFAEELGAIEAKLVAGEYADTDIAAIVLEVKGITNRYMLADAMIEASKDNPIDVTDRVVEQASFDGNTYTSWIASSIPTMAYGIVEFTNTTFDIHQELYGMPAGVYQLQAQAFYRYGNEVLHYSAYNNGNIKRNAKLYISHSTAEMQTADVMAISDDPSEIHQWGEWSTRLYDGLPTPNDLVAASEAIDTLHKYTPKDGYNSVEIFAAETGNLTIGVKKEAKRSNDWTAIGGFSLYYLGKDKGNMAVEDIASSEATVIAIYNTNGIRIATMQKGINILHMSDGTTIKVVAQ